MLTTLAKTLPLARSTPIRRRSPVRDFEPSVLLSSLVRFIIVNLAERTSTEERNGYVLVGPNDSSILSEAFQITKNGEQPTEFEFFTITSEPAKDKELEIRMVHPFEGVKCCVRPSEPDTVIIAIPVGS
jgi:hypothetical protein